jgi:hypothetical protein
MSSIRDSSVAAITALKNAVREPAKPHQYGSLTQEDLDQVSSWFEAFKSAWLEVYGSEALFTSKNMCDWAQQYALSTGKEIPLVFQSTKRLGKVIQYYPDLLPIRAEAVASTTQLYKVIT